MDAPVWKPETTSTVLFVLLSAFFALVWALLCCVMRAWSGLAVAVLLPLPALLWHQWQRRRSVVFFADHLEDRSWFSTRTVPYGGADAQLRSWTPRSRRGDLGSQQPLLVLRRHGRILAAIPRSLRPQPETLAQTLDLLRAAGVPVRRLS